ncbi:MAG: hypothetical protein LH477_09910 [Nocardioides sp.]|nr:hypothetical protein [Nocardioides sp.]
MRNGHDRPGLAREGARYWLIGPFVAQILRAVLRTILATVDAPTSTHGEPVGQGTIDPGDEPPQAVHS